MKKEKGTKQLIIVMIVATLVLILGTSYAIFMLTLKAEKELSVTTGTFAIEYKDQNVINLENTYPMSDVKGMKLSPYEFSVENTGNIKALYDISLELKESSNLDYKWLKYSLKRNEEVWSTPKKLTSLKLEEGLELEPSTKDTYQLRLWIDENTGNEAQGKVLIAKVVVNSVQSNASTIDLTQPVITLKGSLSESVEQDGTYKDPGVESVSDDRDTLEISDVKVSYKYLNGETTEAVESIDTSRVGVYYIYYTIKDASGNEGRVVRSVNVYQKDSRPPEIRLNGKAIVALNKGEHYEELGATARKEEEDLTGRVVTVGTVNEKRTGTYEIKYLITDQVGNTASIVRIVNVISVSKEPVQELTIDLSKNPTEKITMEGENLGEITYTSSDATIAGVDSEGTITGVTPGETVIHITTSNGVTKEVYVKVVKTVHASYVKQGSGVESIGKSSDSCEITNKSGSCEVVAPAITVSTGYTAVGWNTNKEATSGTAPNEKITLNSDITYFSISYQNEKTYTVNFNANGNAVAETSKSCTIDKAYNTASQGTSCSVTTPVITAPSATPTVVGYNQDKTAKTSEVGSNAGLTVTSSINGKTYYAITKKASVTRSVTYTKGAGVSSIGKTSDSCTIGETYNNTAQGTSCSVTLPSITSSTGYNTGFWSTSNTATSGSSAGASISLSGNSTYYARALDTTKPVWSLVSTSPASGTISPSGSLVITFKGTDTSGSVTSTLVAGNITVKSGSTTVSPSTKTLSSASNVTNGKQYSLTLSGIHTEGVISITIASSTIKDGSNNANNATTLTTGVTLADYLYKKVLSNVGSAGSLDTSDSEQTFITGANPNNYVWYSGKLWRVISKDTSDNSVKMMTEEPISSVSYNPSSNTTYKGSQMEQWLNDTSTEGFLGTLKDRSKYLKLNSKWNATTATTDAKPAKTTMVENAVGLITMYESKFNYDFRLSFYTWMLTPYDGSRVWMRNYNGSRQAQNPEVPYSVQPVINIKSNILATTGNGTHDNPYRLEGDDTAPNTGTLLNTRYSGEYVSFGSGENNLYRIVSQENGGTKIVSASPLKQNSTVITKTFSKTKSSTYNPSSTDSPVAHWLNHDFINNGYYFTTHQLTMIQSNTWYLGKIMNGMHYRLAKYTTATGTTLVSSKVNAEIGLLRMGELLAGQINNGSAFWLLTPHTTEGYVRVIQSSAYSATEDATSSYSLRPALLLKSAVKITSGDGTRQKPFVLSYQKA